VSNVGRHNIDIRRATPATDEAWLATWLGWTHVAEGKGYDPLYEALDQPQQLNYERGRAMAASVRGRTGRVPHWPTNQDLVTVMMTVDRITFHGVAEELALFHG
jgi:hypothetical protein